MGPISWLREKGEGLTDRARIRATKADYRLRSLAGFGFLKEPSRKVTRRIRSRTTPPMPVPTPTRPPLPSVSRNGISSRVEEKLKPPKDEEFFQAF